MIVDRNERGMRTLAVGFQDYLETQERKEPFRRIQSCADSFSGFLSFICFCEFGALVLV
jgi:hypothetical protein